MPLYSENQIRSLHAEFKSQKKYTDKLVFFDRWFGIIPFPFPDFDCRLSYFFQNDKTNELAEIYKKERNNPGLTEKKFIFDETFVFSIKPANSNSSAYSNFILSSFLSRKPVFEEWIRKNKTSENSVEFLLGEANGLMNEIEYCLQNEYDKSFRLQCMSVFYKGFYDAFVKRVNLPGKKRKFIELYLYAAGIVYASYIYSLKMALRRPQNTAKLYMPLQLDRDGKLALLFELGIVDFLTKKFAGMESEYCNNKVAEILSEITGENIEQKHLGTTSENGFGHALINIERHTTG